MHGAHGDSGSAGARGSGSAGGGRGDGDGWVWCEHGHKHWGRFGAAGLLVRDRRAGSDRVVLQHRALWSHHGGTWGLPGGARDSHESAVGAALREAAEEAGVGPGSVRLTGLVFDDHGGWSYTNVLAEPVGPLTPRAGGRESIEVRWTDVGEVDRLPLHPGFAGTWPRLRSAPPGTALVVDGANVVGARGRGDGWWRDRAGAARRLRDALVRLAVAGIPVAHLPATVPGGGLDVVLARIVLVVEGAAGPVAAEPVGPPPGEPLPPGLLPGQVTVTAAGGSGDDAIVAVAAAAATVERVLVVTADRALTGRVTAVGAAPVRPSWLLRLIDAPEGK